MKITDYVIVGMSIAAATPLWADPPLTRHEQKRARMEANRSFYDEHTRKAQEEFRHSTAELSSADEQQLSNVQQLRSVDRQVTAGKKEKTIAHQTYKEAVRQYGPEDPKSAAAKGEWKESQQRMEPLLESQQTLREDVHRGGRLVHNDKIVLEVQKRDMDSDARYRAI